MQGSISYSDLGFIILFLIVFTVGGYLIVTIKNTNRLIGELTKLVSSNQQQFRQILENLHQISEDGVEIGREVKKGADQASRAIDIGVQGTSEAVANLSKTADDIGTYAVVIGEIARAVTHFFMPKENSKCR
jgi:predicted PurR-regulated permease PerM